MVLKEGEDRTDFVREAVVRELKRRIKRSGDPELLPLLGLFNDQ